MIAILIYSFAALIFIWSFKWVGTGTYLPVIAFVAVLVALGIAAWRAEFPPVYRLNREYILKDYNSGKKKKKRG